MGISELWKISDANSRSISPENVTGEKGKGGMAINGTGERAARNLGQGWKISPSIDIEPHEVFTIAEIEGPGIIKHIWMTITGSWRHSILRIYWDDCNYPSVESPVGDFFASGWNEFSQINSLAVCVNPGSAFNCYWEMPFKRKCKIEIENIDDSRTTVFYQIDYSLEDLQHEIVYFHAQFRRSNPIKYGHVYNILSDVAGRGQYVGTYMAWGVNNSGWWGEGEIKFFLDGDADFPSICGTGTEDYFCGSYNFENPNTHNYQEYTTPYSGLHQIIRPDGVYKSQMRFGMYRWHIIDPIYFHKDISVTIQALGWRKDGTYLPLQDDISSVAYWYQTLPHSRFPGLPDKNYLEII